MFNFRKSSLSWRQQVSKMFQNEKRVRKNGSVEHATFDFYDSTQAIVFAETEDHNLTCVGLINSRLLKLILKPLF